MSIILDGSLPAGVNAAHIIDSSSSDSNSYDADLCLTGTWQFAKDKKTDLGFKYTWISTEVNMDLINYVSFLDRSRMRTYRRRKGPKPNQYTRKREAIAMTNDTSSLNVINSGDITITNSSNSSSSSSTDHGNENTSHGNDNNSIAQQCIIDSSAAQDQQFQSHGDSHDDDDSGGHVEAIDNDDNDDNEEEDDEYNENDDENNNDDDDDGEDEGEDGDEDGDDVRDAEEVMMMIDTKEQSNTQDNADTTTNEVIQSNYNDNNNSSTSSTSASIAQDSQNVIKTVKIDRAHPLLGLWKGSFNVKNATGGEDSVVEEFFFHKMLNTNTQPELLNLPEDPYFSYTALRHTDISSYLHKSSESSNIDPTIKADDEKVDEVVADNEDEENQAEKAKTLTTGSRQAILIGFGRNVYGRFTVTALLDKESGKFMCEKRYLLSKSGSYRRHRSSDDIETPRQIGQRVRQAPNFNNRFGNNEVGQKRKRNSFPSLKSSKLEKGIKYSMIQAQQFQLYQSSSHSIKSTEDLGYEDDEYKIAFLDEESGEIYEGGWMRSSNGSGRRHGRGICLFTDGTIYEGLWSNGKCQGRGQLMTGTRQIIYTGEWVDGFMQGQGTYNFENGDKYVGDWKEGNRHGKGEYIMKNGCTYNGEWKDNKRHGKGLFFWADGSYYEGAWENDNRNGQGLLHLACGFVYDGNWLNGFMEGRGNCRFPSGSEYQGTYKSGLREGRGSITFAEGAVYEGRFKDDRIDGHGTINLSKSVPGNEEGEIMIPIQIQADMRRIHLKAGFGEEAGFGAAH